MNWLFELCSDLRSFDYGAHFSSFAEWQTRPDRTSAEPAVQVCLVICCSCFVLPFVHCLFACCPDLLPREWFSGRYQDIYGQGYCKLVTAGNFSLAQASQPTKCKDRTIAPHNGMSSCFQCDGMLCVRVCVGFHVCAVLLRRFCRVVKHAQSVHLSERIVFTTDRNCVNHRSVCTSFLLARVYANTSVPRSCLPCPPGADCLFPGVTWENMDAAPVCSGHNVSCLNVSILFVLLCLLVPLNLPMVFFRVGGVHRTRRLSSSAACCQRCAAGAERERVCSTALGRCVRCVRYVCLRGSVS